MKSETTTQENKMSKLNPEEKTAVAMITAQINYVWTTFQKEKDEAVKNLIVVNVEDDGDEVTFELTTSYYDDAAESTTNVDFHIKLITEVG